MIKQMITKFSLNLILIPLICSSLLLASSLEDKLKEGEAYFQTKSYEKAMAIFKEIADREKWDELTAKASLRLGQCYLAKGNYEDAYRYFDKAIGWRGEISQQAEIGIALVYINREKFDTAIKLLSSLINEKAPDKLLAYAYYDRAIAYRKKGWLRKAIEDFQQAILRSESDEELNYRAKLQLSATQSLYEDFLKSENDYLARIQSASSSEEVRDLYHQLAKLCFDNGEGEKAVEYEKKAIEYSRDEEFNGGAYMNIAWEYAREGDYEKAMEYFKKVVEECPSSSYAREALLRMGDMLGYLKKDEEKIEAYNKFVTLYPDDPNAPSVMISLANYYENLGNKEKAKQILQELASRFPNSEQGLYAIGYYEEIEGNYDKAISIYRKAAEANGAQSLSANIALARCLFKSRQYKSAIEAFDKILRDYPDISDGRAAELEWEKSQCYKVLGTSWDKLGALYQRIIGKYPDTGPAALALSEIIAHNHIEGREEEVKKGVEELVSKYKASYPYIVSATISFFGSLCFDEGDLAGAIEWYRKSADEFPEYADEPLLWMGKCYISLGQYEKAIEAFQEILDKYPQSSRCPMATLFKGQCLYKLGQKEKAYQVFKELGERYPNSEEAKQVLDWLALCKE